MADGCEANIPHEAVGAPGCNSGAESHFPFSVPSASNPHTYDRSRIRLFHVESSGRFGVRPIVAILVRTRGWNRQRMLRLSILLLSSALLLTAVGYPFGILTRRSAIGEALQYLPWNLAFASLLGMFLLVGSGPRRLITAPPLMIFFGKISYGLYLYHLMVFFG